MKKITVYESVTITIFFLASCFFRFAALNQTSFANGWDGYYYIMQVYTFFKNGSMRAPDHSLIYPFYIVIYFLTRDLLFAFKIGSSLLSGFFTISIFKFSKILCEKMPVYQGRFKAVARQNTLIPYVIASFSVFSPTLTYFTAQFPKNLLGLIFFIWLLYFLSDRKLVLSGLFFILAFFTHRTTAGLSIIAFIVYFINKRHYKVLITTIVLISIVATLFLPGIIHLYDFERFRNDLFDSIYFPPIRFILFFGYDKVSLMWVCEIFCVFTTFILYAIYVIYNQLKYKTLSKLNLTIIIVLLALALPFYQFGRASFGFRFFMIFNLLAITTLVVYSRLYINKAIFFAIIGLLMILSFYSYQSYSPKNFDPPYKDYFQVVSEVNKNMANKKPNILIAHQGLAQMVIIYSNYNATNWQPIDSLNYSVTWRIAANIKYYYYRKYLDDESIKQLKYLYKDYYLIREDVWQDLKSKVNKSDDKILKVKLNDWYNPYENKPNYLLKGRGRDYIH